MGLASEQTPVLALWSAPRCRSTAFERMMMERGDRVVVHEPFSRVVDFGTVEVGDRVASARNVSQLDVSRNMNEFDIRPVWVWNFDTWLPLRTTNADASGGFYSHHSGYVPFAWTDRPIDRVGLGRVVAVLTRPRR